MQVYLKHAVLLPVRLESGEPTLPPDDCHAVPCCAAGQALSFGETCFAGRSTSDPALSIRRPPRTFQQTRITIGTSPPVWPLCVRRSPQPRSPDGANRALIVRWFPALLHKIFAYRHDQWSPHRGALFFEVAVHIQNRSIQRFIEKAESSLLSRIGTNFGKQKAINASCQPKKDVDVMALCFKNPATFGKHIFARPNHYFAGRGSFCYDLYGNTLKGRAEN
jgi:hypothetical protein